MPPARSRLDSSLIAAMVCFAAISAQFVAGKATRDALYLAQFDVTTLPTMVMVTAIVSIAITVLGGHLFPKVVPSRLMAWAFVGSAAFFVAAWLATPVLPRGTAVVTYLQISGVGPLLGSGFWLIVSEVFDPRTARRRFGQIAGAGTLGGLAGGLVAERVAAVAGLTTTLPLLAALNILCAWQVTRVSPPSRAGLTDPTPRSPRSDERDPGGFRVLAAVPYLRTLAALVLLGTLAAALFDYVFKAQAVSTLGRGDTLLRFFAVYYATVSLVTFVVQASTNRVALERLGLALTASTPSLALLLGTIGAWIAPGLASVLVARGSESALRGSLFRSSYEVFYTPVPSSEKRAAKGLIDVAFDRLGDALSGGIITLILLLPVVFHYNLILAVAAVAASAALWCASRLTKGYVHTLERSLLNRAVELDLTESVDLTTRTAMLRTLTDISTLRPKSPAPNPASPTAGAAPPAAPAAVDRDTAQILLLRGRDQQRIRELLRSDENLGANLVPHVIPLLAWDPVAADAAFALRKVAEERIGQLTDALVDPNTEFAVRRRLARVFSTCVSQRAADAAMLGLDDLRFEVRYQCARSLAAIVDRNPRIVIDRTAVFAIVKRETSVGRSVWRSERLLQKSEEGDPEEAFFVDEVVKDRSSRSLAHVFTLLSLVFPAEPLKIAFRGLHASDTKLRGTALEYLEGILPPEIREPLWPFLEDQRATNRPPRPRDEVLQELLRSNQSIAINLKEIRRSTNRS